MEYKMDIMLCDRINNVKFVLSQYSEATRITSTTDNVIQIKRVRRDHNDDDDHPHTTRITT